MLQQSHLRAQFLVMQLFPFWNVTSKNPKQLLEWYIWNTNTEFNAIQIRRYLYLLFIKSSAVYMCDVTQNKNRHCTATALFHYFKRSCYCVVFKKEAVVSGEYRPSMCIIHNCYILKLTLFKCILSHECIEKLYAFINTKCICSTY